MKTIPEPSSWTETALRGLTWSTIKNCTETRGVAHQRHLRWRRARYQAVDPLGVEHDYKVTVRSDGETTIEVCGKTRGQLDRERRREWLTIPDATRRLVEHEWPWLNDLCKRALAEVCLGRPSTPEARITIGGSARHRIIELFPGVRTMDEACAELRAWHTREINLCRDDDQSEKLKWWREQFPATTA